MKKRSIYLMQAFGADLLTSLATGQNEKDKHE
jgi:hypothetical protein